MLNLNSQYYNYSKINQNISWEYKTPQEIINKKVRTVRIYTLGYTIIDFLLMLRITNYNIILTIVLLLIHLTFFIIFILFLDEYHRYWTKRQYLVNYQKAMGNGIVLSQGEIDLKNRLENSSIKYSKIFGFFLYLMLVVIFVLLINVNSLVKGFFVMTLLIPIFLSKMIVDYSESIRIEGKVDIILDEKRISIWGILNHEYLEEFQFSEIKKIWFIEFYNIVSKWRILNIVFFTNAFRFVSGDLYTEDITGDFSDLINFIKNEFTENNDLSHIELEEKSQEDYHSIKDKLVQKSARVFITIN